MYTVDLAFRDFMIHNERKNLSPESMRYYRENITRFITWLSNNRIQRTSKLTKEIVDAYQLHLLRTVPNRTSVNTYLRAVRRFINYLIERNIIKPFSITMLKEHYKIKPTFDNSEINLIIAAINPADELSMIMLLLLSTGMRSRSLCELQVKDIHFDDGYIDLHATKSGAPLCPPISNAVSNSLKDYIALAKLRPDDFLFRNKCKRKLNKNSLDEHINKRLCKLGINKTGVHIFRHTFGKIMSLNGCPTAILQKWLGHSDIKITQRYTDLYCGDLRNTIEILPTSSFEYT